MNGFWCLGDRLNASGGCKVQAQPVTIGWVISKECETFSLGNSFPLKMKSKSYCFSVRSAILYRRDTKHVKENKKAI